MPDEQDFDVVVVGLGPGGEFAAGELARAGLAVAAVEARLIGGECPYWGCVPSKMMIRAADLLAEGRRIPGMAGGAEVIPGWAPVARRIREEATGSWDDKVAVDRLTGTGARFFRGTGRITAPGVVTVGETALRARRAIILNTGTEPAIPPIEGLAGTPFWTNREAIEASYVPGTVLVLGGGAAGAELAQVFARFGATVTVIEGAGQLLPAEEPETGALLATVFGRDGITVRVSTTARAVQHDGISFTVHLSDGTEVAGDALLVATGRRASLEVTGAGALGLPAGPRAIETDDHLRVPAGPGWDAGPGVWAIGDITGHGAFTHMSMYQAAIVVDDVLGREVHPAEYHAVPRVTFTDPEIGSVGLSERQAREAGVAVATGFAKLPESARGWIHHAGNDGFIKLVADSREGVLTGATSAGPSGGEVLGLLALAVHARVPVRRLREMIYAYPTFHRAIEAALRNLG